MNILKRIISACLVFILMFSFFSMSLISASALSDGARYYESIPKIVYATVGEPFKIYYNNILSLPGLKIVFNVPEEINRRCYDNRIEILSQIAGDFVVSWRVYDSEYVLVDSGEMLFIVRELSLKSATGLVIGDSTVNAGVVTQTLLDIYAENGKNLTLLGTMGKKPNLHEGRGGWTSSSYCNGKESNPFYNGGFDFSYYMTSQGYNKLDFVIIQLGINDIKSMTLENYSSKKILSNFEKIISSIRVYDNEIPIIIGVTIPPSEKIENFKYNTSISSEFEYRNNIIHFASDLMGFFEGYNKVYFSAINCVIDAKDEIEDFLHPTDNGYKHISKQYAYTLNCICNPKIKIKAPEITQAKTKKGHVSLTWSATYGALYYEIIKDNSVIARVNTLAYQDKNVLSGKNYKYEIKAVCENGKAYMSKSKTAYYLTTPVLKSAGNSQNGVVVKWGAVASAEYYNVYRKVSNGSWAKIGKTTGVSFTDKTVKSGTQYFYTVIANTSAGTSAYDSSGVSVVYLQTPILSSATNKNGYIDVKWSSVKGAKGYNVYRKTSKNGKWTKVTSTTGTTYTDKNIKSDGNYIYTVRAYNGENISSYVANGIATKYLSTPKLSKITSKTNGVYITYGKVTGAKGYAVYRKTGKGKWTKIATVTGNNKTTYLDKTAKKGVTYTYTIRAVNGEYMSYYNTTGLKIKDKY